MIIKTTYVSKVKGYKDNVCKDYSISKLLREEKKSNEYFETMLCNLPLEDLIALRMELAYKSLGVGLYGVPIWSGTNYIVKEAILKYAVSISKSKAEAARYLGISVTKFIRLLRRFRINTFFKRGNLDEFNRAATKKDISENKT